MSIKVRQKLATYLEFVVTVPYSNSFKISTENFTFQGRECYLTFEYAFHSGSLYFNSKEKLNPAVEIVVLASCNRRTFMTQERHKGLTGENQIIWKGSTKKMVGSVWNFEIFIPSIITEEQNEILNYKPSTQYNEEKSSDLKTDTQLETLSRDFSKILVDHSSSDVEIACEDRIFKAHKIVLSARSPIFSDMLKRDTAESQTGVIKVENFTASIVEDFLHFLYSGQYPRMNVDSAMEFYKIGDKYGMKELKKASSEFLIKNLSVTNACDLLVFADSHCDPDFKKGVISYIVDENIPKNGRDWPDFCENHPKLATKVLNICILKN